MTGLILALLLAALLAGWGMVRTLAPPPPPPPAPPPVPLNDLLKADYGSEDL